MSRLSPLFYFLVVIFHLFLLGLWDEECWGGREVSPSIFPLLPEFFLSSFIFPLFFPFLKCILRSLPLFSGSYQPGNLVLFWRKISTSRCAARLSSSQEKSSPETRNPFPFLQTFPQILCFLLSISNLTFYLSSHPLITPKGGHKPLFEIPALSTTSTTSPTSLYASGISSSQSGFTFRLN